MAETTREVFEDHLQKRLDGDVEGDIKENFAEDVVLLTGTGILEGHDGVRQSAKEMSKYLGDATFQYNHKFVKGDYAFLEWTAEADGKKVCDGADSFVVKNGKVVFQSIHYQVHDA